VQIAFRVDGSEAIGTGHIVRCLTLADHLSHEGHSCHFIIRDHPGAPVALIEAKGFSCSLLSPPDGTGREELAHASWLGISQARDAEESLAALQGPVDWLVVDHYALDYRWHVLMRSIASKILVIDDIADRRHDCDLLVDQNLQIRSGRYEGLVPPACDVMLGPRYALLRPRFAELRVAMTEVRPDGPALVYFGGVDSQGATLTALTAFSEPDMRDRPVDVVVGDLNPHRETIHRWCVERGNARFHSGGSDMPTLMARASIAVGAAGVTAWERCCLGVPTILVTIAENQKPGAAALARECAAIWVGEAGSISSDTIAAALRTLYAAPSLVTALSHRAAALVDGRGTGRIARAMASAPITVRTATADDCLPVWEWRNAEQTRRYFHDPAPVPIDDHRRWFARSLQNPRRALLIGERSGEPVGVLRFDKRDDAVALVSIYLIPGREGKGEGTQLLLAGHDWLARNWPDVTAVEAEVLHANKASSAAFLSAGFTLCRLLYRHIFKSEEPKK